MNSSQHITPTRLELTKLKQQLAMAERGQKLLKDKQNQLVRSFVGLSRETVALRKEVEALLMEAMETFSKASLSLPDAYITEACMAASGQQEVDVDRRSILNVEIPRLHQKNAVPVVNEHSKKSELRYGYYNTNSELDSAMDIYEKVFPKLLILSEQEKSCQILSVEIEKTRRRVNALEHRSIPNFKNNIRTIQMKLEEEERANITRLIKVKQTTAR